ncbi:MAG: DUF4423 domain-containing protein [Proteobacteria bacterium]|nr:MAG: DUF4423 domain-containing protein [Pseudomonadota bacterium]
MQSHQLLQKYFDKKKANSGYSLRALARDCDVSPSFLSRVLSGQKALPYALLVKMGKVLDLEPEALSSLKASHSGTDVTDTTKPAKTKVESGKQLLTAPAQDWDLAEKSDFSILRNWFYIPILDLTLLESFDGSLEMIADRLGLALPTVEVAVRQLISANLLTQTNGKIRKAKDKLRFASQNNIADIRRFHDQMMAQAQSRLHEIAEDLMQDSGTDIYQLGAQLFPLTKKP